MALHSQALHSQALHSQALHSQALPEKLISAFKIGFRIGELFEKFYDKYGADSKTTVFKFDGETVEDLIVYCNADQWSNMKSVLDQYDYNIFDFICVWVIVNHYESFLELAEMEIKPVITLLERKVNAISHFIVEWDYYQGANWRDQEPNQNLRWSDKTYELMQKLFDDLVDKNFNHTQIWIKCLNAAFIKEDLNRIEYLTSVLDSIETTENKDTLLDGQNKYHLNVHSKIYLKLYPTDISLLNFEKGRTVDYIRYMISHGYIMTNDDLIHALNIARWIDKQELTKIFLENLHLANFTQEFVDKCFEISIKNNEIEIFDFFLENHNPNLYGVVTNCTYCYHRQDFVNPFYLVSAIISKKKKIAITLMNVTDFDHADPKIHYELIRAIITMFDQDLASKLTQIIVPTHEITSHCLDTIYNVATKSVPQFVVRQDLISFAYKLGCAIDEEYLHKILEFLDLDALDLILQNLNLILDDIPFDLVSKIVNSNLAIHQKMIEEITLTTTTYKQQQYVFAEVKTRVKKFCQEYTTPSEMLTAIYKMNKYGLDVRATNKIDHNLFDKLYKFYSDQTNTQMDLIGPIKKVVDEFVYVVNRCLDHKTFNALDGRVPEPIIWDNVK
jgi:hypothetical protein